LQGARGGLGQLASGEASHGAGEVVGHHGQGQPGGVGHELPRGQVGQAGALELGDALLDDRAVVIGLDFDEVAGAVGDEGVVVQVVNSASWLPGVGRTRRTTSRTSTASAPEKAV
jgi:hypothetical protein